MTRSERAGLDVILDVFRKPGKKELKVGGDRVGCIATGSQPALPVPELL